MKKARDTIIFDIRRNRSQILTFVKYFFKFETYFFLCIRRPLSNHHEKRKKYSSEILNSVHITYSVNTLKREYLGPGSL
jgi:hypothetical protein